MFKNLIKYSIRSFKRQRAYIIINILGLAIGIACSLLIALYIINEASFDKYNIRPEYFGKLDEAAQKIKEHPEKQIEVQGHTDNIGTFQYNQRLSERRANTVEVQKRRTVHELSGILQLSLACSTTAKELLLQAPSLFFLHALALPLPTHLTFLLPAP